MKKNLMLAFWLITVFIFVGCLLPSDLFANTAGFDEDPQKILRFNQNQPAKNMAFINIKPLGIDFFEEQDAYSYKDYNDSWQSLRSFHLMKNMDTPLKIYVANNRKLFKNKYRDYVEESLAIWSGALEGKLKYNLTDFEQDAHIKIYWVEGFGDKYQAGETDCSIEKATIWIKTTELPDNQIKANIMHEMGHALGILGHSDDKEDIMQGEREWNNYKEFMEYEPRLSINDVKAIQRLYSLSWVPGEDLYKAVSRATVAKAVVRVP